MDRLRDFAARIGAWPRSCALALGVIGACGFQPLALWPLTLLAIAGLVELVARADSGRRAALLGWWFGLGHFTLGSNWIATAFTYQAEMPAWLGWIAVVALAAYLAVYPAMATLAAWFLARRFKRATHVQESWPMPLVGLVLVPCWIVTEWMRGWVFTGFAWNPLGVALLGGFDAQGIAFLAPWLGTYGLSGLAVLLATWLRYLVHSLLSGGARNFYALASWHGPLAAIVIGGMIAPASYLSEPVGRIAFTLVQPDIRQEELNDPAYFETNFWKVARLTGQGRPGEPRAVFWPESGLPDYLREGYPSHYYRQVTYAADPLLARRRIGRVIGYDSLLMTGAVDLVIEDGEAVAARNVITAIDANGAIPGSYAKAHLVPYGEYLALRWLLEPLGATRLVPGALDFWPGPGPRTYDFGAWGRAGMQICYEIVFSGEVVERGYRPDYIFNPSNDGWFGSWGPPQHLAQARLRAIEEGLPVLRATTTGISAVIDADGIVRQHIPRHRAASLSGRIPPAHAPTPFARLGNALPLGWALLLFAISLVALRRSKG